MCQTIVLKIAFATSEGNIPSQDLPYTFRDVMQEILNHFDGSLSSATSFTAYSERGRRSSASAIPTSVAFFRQSTILCVLFCLRVFSVSGMRRENMMIGTIDIANEPDKLMTGPRFCTTICPI
mmetsp:Transcript_38510/g.44879  ORF Transcript_38510/g.44879 Transcript_38510/m.44879 type:complete len:123 (-) Transcript_38510:1363-1731(-)